MIQPIESCRCNEGDSHSILDIAEWLMTRADILGIRDERERIAYALGAIYFSIMTDPSSTLLWGSIIGKAVAWQSSLFDCIPPDNIDIYLMTFSEWAHREAK